eukprot:XP_016657829.1 PREDICTED: aspartyl/glutamyl-tRNA(Asn/Gln) amidotransferase subunit B-like [Acyrthosiphon pisum]
MIELNKRSIEPKRRYVKLVNLVHARKVIAKMVDEKNKSPSQIVEENNWQQISNVEEIDKLCIEIMLEYPKAVKDYCRGKLQAKYIFINHIANKTNDRANLALVSKKLEEFLNNY